MAQFDVHKNGNPSSKRRIPFLLDVQTDLLGSLLTRVVVPLAKPEVLDGKVASRLNPSFEIDGVRVVMLTPELAGVKTEALGPKVTNLSSSRAEIIAALDIVFTGIRDGALNSLAAPGEPARCGPRDKPLATGAARSRR